MNQLNTIQIVASPLAHSLIGYSTANRVRGVTSRFIAYWRRLTGVGLMVLFGVWLSLVATALVAQPYVAQPYDGDVSNQLPPGVSVLRPMSVRDAQRPASSVEGSVGSFRSDLNGSRPTNLSGMTRPFVKQSADSALYAEIVERTPWRSEWRSDSGETCLQSAAKSFNLDPVLILAVIEQESSFDPDARNLNDNESVDLGLMQINSQWHEFLSAFGIQEKHLRDPCVNTHIGAWILNLSINEVGDVWRGVGAYNAGTRVTPGAEQRRQAYAKAVLVRFNALNEKLGREPWDLAALDF